MKKFHRNPILIIFILIFHCFLLVNSFPCPSECICKPTNIVDEDFTRMSYIIDCTNVELNNTQLQYHAESWSILEDKITVDNDDDDIINDYILSIILSNSSLLNSFNNQTIQLTGYSFLIQSLSITNQSKDFLLQTNAFNSNLYTNLKILNLSSCCQQIPTQCPQLFTSLSKLEILDLSQSDLYKTCLNTPNTITSNLRDLILRSNQYNHNTFSHSSELFNGVRHISGKLDLSYSYFNMSDHLDGNCLFDLFEYITILDLSSSYFQSITNDIEIHLKHLIRCKNSENKIRQGEQLLELYLQNLNIKSLPNWFTNDRFPRLTHLDLSLNQIYSIDLQLFTKLIHISLAYNPIEYDKILWRSDTVYQSINIRSINSTNFSNLENLFQYATNIDYSLNSRLTKNNLTKFSIPIDFSDVALNLSQTNLYFFDIEDLTLFDNLYHLDISSNHLIELNLEKQRKLTYLDCSNQQLKNLILNKDYSNLIYFKCSNNSLKSIENFSQLKHEYLQFIDLSSNKIESLDDYLLNINSRYLQTINFQSNFIEKIRTNLFSNKLLSLYSINLSFNKINFIEKYAFQSPNLQILDLTGNPLKNLDEKFLLSPSLRLFYIINTPEDFKSRCAQSKSTDQLFLTYMNWFEKNGSYMKKFAKDKSDLIQFNNCFRQYVSRSKVKWTKFNDQYQIKHLSLYITLFAISMGILLGGIYMYKKNQFGFLRNFQRYRPLNRNDSMDNTNQLSQDEEVIMNLDEPSFHTTDRV